jgi:glycosyltransferase involved in cell wall biosynthesis
VIPAYNEEKLIKPTVEGVPDYIDSIIVIDDGSKDRTAEVVIGIRDERIRLIRHHKNLGLGSAIITGYKNALENGFDAAVVVGGDNQMDLSELPKFLEPIIMDNADYVKGNRFLNRSFLKMPPARFMGNILLSAIEKPATGYWNIFDMHDGYTVINKKALKAVDWDNAWTGYAYNVDFLARLNIHRMKVKDIPRQAIYLKGERQSQIKTLRYMLMAIPLIIRTWVWRIEKKYLKA